MVSVSGTTRSLPLLGSVFVWRCSSLPAEDMKRKQKLWHRGSTNTERGAVATWSVTITNELIVAGPGRYRSWFSIVDPRC